MYPDVGCEQLPLLPPAAGVVAPHGAEDAAGVVRGVGGVVGLPGRLPPHGGLHIVQLTLPSPAQPSPAQPSPAQPSPALTHFDLVLLRPEGGCWLGWVGGDWSVTSPL